MRSPIVCSAAKSSGRAHYEKELGDYERAAVKANIWSSALPPLYRVISMAGILPIVWFGAQNIAGKGWTAWDRRGVYDLPVLFYEAGDEIIQRGEAVQCRT